MAVRVFVVEDAKPPVVRQRCIDLGADGVISKAQFGALRAYLQAFPGRVQEAEAA